MWRVWILLSASRLGEACGLGAALRAVAGLLVLALGASPAVSSAWTPAKSAAVDGLVTQFLARVDATRGTLPEASLALVIGDQAGAMVAKGYGEPQPGMPATAHTVYHVGSIAKQFTAAAVLDLIGRKARLRDGTPLTLDLALSRIFEGVDHWPGMDADNGKQPVTLRTLLTMTSNLPNFTRRPPSATDPWGRIGAPELLSELKKLEPWGWPNTFEYSNTSYFLLAEVIEEALAPGEPVPRSHHDILRRTIFPRAGLVETGFVEDYAPGAILARPIHRKKPVFDQPDWLKGSADIASSAMDLYAWNAALMSGRVLPPDVFALMVSDGARVTPDLYYGMGWFVEHRAKGDVFTHSGLVPGYTSYSLIATGSAKGGTDTWMSITLLVNTDMVDGLDLLAEDLLRLARE
ncbi:serine hydrolase domain-containing protein [Hyphomicrobium sp.]|uniref:serine hydrolase domain-containing protein n=1 Tax=Hyphomicrobium sp. TaxID=82 RepID=UPI0025C3378C|nr:serine hydrolase domain-containing protein [Hyphomicrobium sp.]MCC7252834.1 beta-lactamase family protein [Hyphomicrobium sp.]